MSEFISAPVGFLDDHAHSLTTKDSKGPQGGAYNDVNYDCFLSIPRRQEDDGKHGNEQQQNSHHDKHWNRAFERI